MFLRGRYVMFDMVKVTDTISRLSEKHVEQEYIIWAQRYEIVEVDLTTGTTSPTMLVIRPRPRHGVDVISEIKFNLALYTEGQSKQGLWNKELYTVALWLRRPWDSGVSRYRFVSVSSIHIVIPRYIAIARLTSVVNSQNLLGRTNIVNVRYVSILRHLMARLDCAYADN